MDNLKPWRRKIGVVTLGLTCMFMSGWIRSGYFVDYFHFFPPGHSLFVLISEKSNVIFILWQNQTGNRAFAFETSETSDAIDSDAWMTTDIELNWRKQWLGFDFAIGINNLIPQVPQPMTYFSAPYWSIVIPLTLLSAWLLRSKPRVAKPTAIGEK